MRLLFPQGGIKTQGFLGNANTWYRENRLSGHPGYDVFVGHGSSVEAIAGIERAYKVFKGENKTDDGANAVFTLHLDPALGWVEFCYFHLSEVFVSEGDVLTQGQPLGKEGNTGVVFKNGVRVTCQASGCTDGSHRHYQGRNVLRVRYTAGKTYLSARVPKDPTVNGAYVDEDGFCYEVTNPRNGANGCFDLEPFWFFPSLIERYLTAVRALLYIFKRKA